MFLGEEWGAGSYREDWLRGRGKETAKREWEGGRYAMTPFDSHFSPTATSCRLALLEMRRFTAINLLAHLQEQSIMEGAGVITMEPRG